MKFAKATIASLIISASCLINTASAGMIGVFGDYSSSTLQSNLQALGHTVTNLGINIDQDLNGFDSVWGSSAFDPLSASENTYLTNYLSSGGGLFLTGERPCCEVLNASIQTLLNSVVIAGGIQVGGLGDMGSSMLINAQAIGNLASTPNTITTWAPSASGGIGGVTGNNVFAYNNSGVTAAAWDMSDLVGNSGRIVLMMDVNWHSGPDSNDMAIYENIENFLDGATNNSGPSPVAVPEPSTLAIFGLALVGLASRRFKKQA